VKREDIAKLLGGYAAGILTAEERRTLFTAALSDQDLFDELMREQPLRELLHDAGARRELGAALAPRSHARQWWWAAPAAAFAAVLLIAVALQRTPQPRPVLVAKLETAGQDQQAPPPASEGTVPQAAKARERAAPRRALTLPPAAITENTIQVPPPPVLPPAEAEKKAAPVSEPLLSMTDSAAPAQAGRAEFLSAARPTRRAAASLANQPASAAPASARDLFYGIAPRAMMRAAADVGAETLGLRYTLEPQFLIIESNRAARLRLTQYGVVLFDRHVEARVRQRIPLGASPQGLRIALEQPGAQPTMASEPLIEHVDTGIERAVYVAAPPGARSLAVTVP
jgi:hypothetical protein